MGIGIQENHATIFREENNFFIEPFCKESSNSLYLNGEKVLKKTQIYNWDRIMFSLTTIFIFRNPEDVEKPRNFESSEQINWEKC